MAVRSLFDAIFIFAIVVPWVMSESDLFSVPETEVSLNDEVLAFDQSTSPINFDLSPQDGSDLLFGDMENNQMISNGDDGFDQTFELVDCSSSSLFPARGKSRMMRRDGSPECKDPALTPPTDSIGSESNPPFDATHGLFGTEGMMLLNPVRATLPENSDCKLFTLGALNFGVCHTGEGEENTNYFITLNGIKFGTVNLQNGFAAPGFISICPSPQKLYCCAKAYYDLSEQRTSYRGNYRGEICISMSALMGEPPG